MLQTRAAAKLYALRCGVRPPESHNECAGQRISSQILNVELVKFGYQSKIAYLFARARWASTTARCLPRASLRRRGALTGTFRLPGAFAPRACDGVESKGSYGDGGQRQRYVW